MSSRAEGERPPNGPPSARWHISTDAERCTVVFEPVGSEYELTKGERLLVEMYGESRTEDGDVDFFYDEGRASRSGSVATTTASMTLLDKSCAFSSLG